MMLKYIFGLLVCVSMLQAANVTSQLDNYNAGQTMTFSVAQMAGNNDDWIGIYPAGASNDWGNVVAWKWTDGVVNGDIQFNSIAAGNYEARVFFNNSFNVEASAAFTVLENQQNTSVSTSKEQYNAGESVIVTVANMAGNNNDWVGIYPAGASNDWGNVIAWDWTNGIVNGDINLGTVPAGNYEVRVFFNNSFNMQASDTFTMEGVVNNTTVSSSKENYNNGEPVIVTVANMAGNNNDWVGIYPAGASNDWGNVIAWDWTNGIVNGDINLGTVPPGDYEVRVFFNNSFNMQASDTFTVNQVILPPTVYEDAENGLADWNTVAGNFSPQRHTANGHSFVKLPPYWINSYTNTSEYHLTMNNNSQKILSVDIGGDGHNMPHYVLGVRVSTTDGPRRLMWNSFYNHNHIPATRKVYGNAAFITFPSPVEQVRGFGYADVNLWENFTVNLEEALHTFEPNNTILSVDYFLATGGNLDNLMLKSN